jgi:GNAT superfamily N-acetyltransferase
MRILGQTRLYVNELGVAEAYRRRGVATRLLTSAERWGREHGATLVYLDTYAYSPLSVPFYEHRMGYRRASITFEKRLEG